MIQNANRFPFVHPEVVKAYGLENAIQQSSKETDGWASLIAAFGLALLVPFQMLSRWAFSFGDSIYLDRPSDPPLLSLLNENPLERGRGALPGEVGVIGPRSMLIVQSVRCGYGDQK